MQAFCIKGSQYWCSASLLSFYMTVCRPLTARIEDCTYFSFFCIKIVELPWDYIYHGFLKLY